MAFSSFYGVFLLGDSVLDFRAVLGFGQAGTHALEARQASAPKLAQEVTTL